MRFRDDKSTANDEIVVKRIINSIQDGVTKEQLLLCMDRVRAAWKAREKGLPMPPLPTQAPKTLTNLILSTQHLPSSSAMNTPTFSSPVVNSPSTSLSSTGYFRDREDINRNNSISEESPTTKRKSSASEDVSLISNINRKSSVSSQSATPLKEVEPEKEQHYPVEKKRLKAVVEEGIPVNNTQDDTEGTLQEHLSPVQQSIEQPTIQQTEHIPRRRKKSSFGESLPLKKLPMEEPVLQPSLQNSQTPPLPTLKSRNNSPEFRQSVPRTISAPTVVLKQKESSPQPRPLQFSRQSPGKNVDRVNRRSKSIPQLHNETAPTTAKKLKSASSSIQNLLTTSVEPTSGSNRAYDFSNILQKKQTEHQPAMMIQQQQQPQQPQQPVQFINFHAEGRHNSNNHPSMNSNPHRQNNHNNHILIIRSESNSEPSPPLHPAHIAPPPPPPPPRHHAQQQIRKNNVKYEGRLLQQHGVEPSYSPYNVVSSVPPYHHSPPTQSFQQQHSSYYGQPYPQQPPPAQPYPAGVYHPHRHHEQQVAYPYPPQQQPLQHPQQPRQQQQQHSQQQSVQPNPKRKNSQKAKLDFILN